MKKGLHDKTIEILGTQLANAEIKHPVFCKSNEHAVTIITEELGELAQAVLNEESKERQIEEAAHVAVTAIRFIEGKLQNDF
jgi:hypothetical protein